MGMNCTDGSDYLVAASDSYCRTMADGKVVEESTATASVKELQKGNSLKYQILEFYIHTLSLMIRWGISIVVTLLVLVMWSTMATPYGWIPLLLIIMMSGI